MHCVFLQIRDKSDAEISRHILIKLLLNNLQIEAFFLLNLFLNHCTKPPEYGHLRKILKQA